MNTHLFKVIVIVVLISAWAVASPVQRDNEAVPVGIKRVGLHSQVVSEWELITLRPGPPAGGRPQLVAEIDGRRVLIEAITVRNHPEGLTPFR